MFKLNKPLWYTVLVFGIFQIVLCVLLKFVLDHQVAARNTFICFVCLPLIIGILHWIWSKIRFGSIKAKKVKGLTPRDQELIKYYLDKPVTEIGHQDLGRIWIKNSIAYYLAYSASLFISVILLIIIEFA